MRTRTIALLTCVTLCSISTAAQSVEISGSWKIDAQNGPSPTCAFEQVGNNLTGSCIGPNAQGPIVGTMTGDQTRWRWQWVSYTGSSGAFDFVGIVRPDNTMTGAVLRRETNLSLNFTAKRQQRSPAPAASAQPGAPAVNSDQQLLDVIERRAARLFPWASQEDQRRQYIIDEMRAAADRRQSNSYSIHVTK